MEAAAKTVEVLSKRILPEKPHHLSVSTTWRFRPAPDDDEPEARGAKRRFEEWHNTRLQYLTFLSEADRGTLFTRPYYDMREEPVKPVPREVSALSKAAGAGEKKKLSLSDYKNKKTGAVASTSPPEPSIAKRKESERAALAVASATSTPASLHNDGGKSSRDTRRSDGSRTRELGSPSFASASAKLTKSNRETAHVDMRCAPATDNAGTAIIQAADSLALIRLPPKPSSLPPRPPSPANKRLMPDTDDDRPQKRLKPDDRRAPGDDRSHSGRDNPPRRKDKAPLPLSSARDRDAQPPLPPSREDRGQPPSSLPNGRSTLKNATLPGRSTPPAPAGKPRGDMVNGVRSGAAGRASSRGTPTKLDAKAHVPPLLSPLHPSFDGREKRSRVDDDDDANPRKERRRPGEMDEATAVSRPKKMDSVPAPVKKPRSSITIPSLLSPTLPPVVEAELKKRKKSSSESSEEGTAAKGQADGRDALGIERRAAGNSLDGDIPKLVQKPVRRRLLVVLTIPKHLRASFARVLQGPSLPRRKDSQSHSEREHGQSRATNDETTHPSPARKRPLGAAEGLADATASKRPRTSEVSGYPKPSTPLTTPPKKPTNMARIPSTNSGVHTPIDNPTSTPSASASVDRRLNGSGVPGKMDKTEAKMMKEKEERLKDVGKKLKHDADLIMKRYRGDMKDKPGESKVKLGYVLSLESIIAFMMAFQTGNLHRSLYNRVGDVTGWSSMFPLMKFLAKEILMRRSDSNNYQPLYAMVLTLQAIAHDEIVKCLLHYENPLNDRNPTENIVVQEREKYKLWLRVHEANVAVPSSRLRVDVHPWSTLDDVTEASLRLLRSYCAEERIEWTQEQTLKDSWPIKPGYPRR